MKWNLTLGGGVGLNNGDRRDSWLNDLTLKAINNESPLHRLCPPARSTLARTHASPALPFPDNLQRTRRSLPHSLLSRSPPQRRLQLPRRILDSGPTQFFGGKQKMRLFLHYVKEIKTDGCNCWVKSKRYWETTKCRVQSCYNARANGCLRVYDVLFFS